MGRQSLTSYHLYRTRTPKRQTKTVLIEPANIYPPLPFNSETKPAQPAGTAQLSPTQPCVQPHHSLSQIPQSRKPSQTPLPFLCKLPKRVQLASPNIHTRTSISSSSCLQLEWMRSTAFCSSSFQDPEQERSMSEDTLRGEPTGGETMVGWAS